MTTAIQRGQVIWPTLLPGNEETGIQTPVCVTLGLFFFFFFVFLKWKEYIFTVRISNSTDLDFLFFNTVCVHNKNFK